MNEHKKDSNARELSFDIKRSLILSQCINHWGLPMFRTISTKKTGEKVEVYEFYDKESHLSRFLTIGVSSSISEGVKVPDWEFLFILNHDSSYREAIVNYLLDIMACSLQSNVLIKIGATIPTNDLAPSDFKARAILFDEPRGEPEEFTSIKVGSDLIHLYWVIPIHDSEYNLIKMKGLDSFDQLEKDCNVSLTDPRRQAIL